jgi:hypothetical protein
MRKSRFDEEQIISILKESKEAGVEAGAICAGGTGSANRRITAGSRSAAGWRSTTCAGSRSSRMRTDG